MPETISSKNFEFRAPGAKHDFTEPQPNQDIHPQLTNIHDVPSSSVLTDKLKSQTDLSPESVQTLLTIAEHKTRLVEAVELTEDEAEHTVTEIVNSPSPELDKIDRIAAWVAADHTRINSVEKMIAEQSSSEITISTIILLARINEHNPNTFTDDTLAETFELKKFPLSLETENQLTALVRLDTPETKLVSHKIFDFFHRYMVTVQDHTEDALNKKYGPYSNGFFETIHRFAQTEKDKNQNYLLKQHLIDLEELINMYDSPKSDAIPGVAGGATDETIYRYNHGIESYQNRLALDITSGYPLKNLLLKIAPGFCAAYKNNTLETVYPTPDKEKMQQAKDFERQSIASNSPGDNHIYAILNAPLPKKIDGRATNPSRKLDVLKQLWKLQDQLVEGGRTFYFDFDQLDIQNIHPMVLADIVMHNENYRKQFNLPSTATQPILENEYFAKLFPLQNNTPEQRYLYEYLTNLGMRQRIQREFGIELADFDFWVQRNFLSFLETCSVEKSAQTKKFITQYGPDALSAFVALEEDAAAGEKLLVLSTSIPSEHFSKLLHLYSRIATLANGNLDELSQFINDEKKISPEQLATVAKQGLFKAQELLSTIKNPEDAIAKLERLSDDAVIFRSFCSTLLKEGQLDFKELKGITLESMKGNELSQDDTETMTTIASDNWKSFGELGNKVSNKFKQDFTTAPDADFYILRKDAKIISFVRFDAPDHNNRRYAGSFNVAPEIRGSGIGEAMIKETLNREAEHHILTAVFHPTFPVNSKYVEQTGFVLTGLIPNFEETGNAILQAECDLKKNLTYTTRTMSSEELQKNLAHDQTKTLPELLQQTTITTLFDTESNYQTDIENMHTILEAGFVGTRFLPSGEDKNKRIVVFEKKQYN